MENLIRRVMIVMLSISALLVLCSCRMEESYKEFIIKSITDNPDKNYFTSDKFDFAKIGNVVIIPEIKEVNHGEYIIYISAYSETGTENITVKKIILKKDRDELLNHELNKKIKFNEDPNAIYEGWIDGCTFTSEEIEIADGKEYVLIVSVESTKNDVAFLKDVTFEIAIKGYKSFVSPT